MLETGGCCLPDLNPGRETSKRPYEGPRKQCQYRSRPRTQLVPQPPPRRLEGALWVVPENLGSIVVEGHRVEAEVAVDSVWEEQVQILE